MKRTFRYAPRGVGPWWSSACLQQALRTNKVGLVVCGIAGYWGNHAPNTPNLDSMRKMTDALRHRGPDDEGIWLAEGENLALGHRRLSILDLSAAGRQPMTSASGRFTIVFNGEIYNFKALRAELAALGYPFLGGSDTEVLLAGFEHWSEAYLLERIAGMFAFALWDARKHQLLMARDPAGEKPLYYGWLASGFYFASELTSIVAGSDTAPAVDGPALAGYLQKGYFQNPWSVFEGIYKLPAGTALVIRSPRLADGFDPSTHPEAYTPSSTRYAERPELGSSGAERQIDDVDRTLRSVIEDEMTADVPLGAFLSGGIDSSLVSAIAQSISPRPLKTFTISFDVPGFNEAAFARDIADFLGTDHREIEVGADKLLEQVPGFAGYLDEPHANPSQIPLYMLCSLARQDVKVCLSGDGGDELFCGYNRYVEGARLWRLSRRVPSPVSRTIARGLDRIPVATLERMARRMAPDRHEQDLGLKLNKLGRAGDATSWRDLYDRLTSYPPHRLTPEFRPRAHPMQLCDGTESSDPREQAMAWDLKSYLPDDNLAKVDRVSMAASLEVRNPLLHTDVVACSHTLPMTLKFRDGQKKWILYEVLRRYLPPRLYERPKMGFTVPIAHWLVADLRDWAGDLIQSATRLSDGLIDAEELKRLWNELQRGRWQYANVIWAALQFLAWRDLHTR